MSTATGALTIAGGEPALAGLAAGSSAAAGTLLVDVPLAGTGA